MIPLSHHLQWEISDVVGKRGTILGVAIFIFDIFEIFFFFFLKHTHKPRVPIRPIVSYSASQLYNLN